MDLRKFQATLFEKGKQAGFGEMELYYQGERETTIRVYKGDIDSYLIAEKGGVSFRGEIAGKIGNSFTEKLDEESIHLLLQEAQENAEVVENENIEELFAGSPGYTTLNLYSEAVKNTTPDQLIEATKLMEKTALEADPRIDLVNVCSIVKFESEVTIVNTKGLNCHTESNFLLGMVSVVAKENGSVTSAYQYGYTKQGVDDLNVVQVAQEAAAEALSRLGGQTIESGEYPVIFKNQAAATLLQAFTSIFSGEAASKGWSLLQGKIGERVVGANITIVDDPHLDGAPGATPFDSEGMATKRHEVIRDGKLLTFLHNSKSAKLAGVESTGNATKTSYRSPVVVQPNNLLIEAGKESLDELTAGIERGLMIVDLQGVHAGTNTVSGDFSLSCLGYLIEAGQVVRPVNQITVSGNFIETLNSVEGLGNDLYFKGFGRGACGAPSLKIKSLSIAGK